MKSVQVVTLDGTLGIRSLVIQDGIAVAFQYVEKDDWNGYDTSYWTAPDMIMCDYLQDRDIPFNPVPNGVNVKDHTWNIVVDADEIEYIDA